MKKQFKRLLALLLVAVFTLLVSCANTKQEQTVVGTCAGYDVLYEELRFVTLTYKDMLESTYGEGIWDDPTTAEKYRSELEELVNRNLLNNYAVLAACNYYMGDAMRAGAMEDKDIVAAVDAQIEEMIASYNSKGEYRKDLEEQHLTEHFLRFTLTVAQIENELLHVLTQDLGLIENDLKTFVEWLKNGNGVYVQHIFVRNDQGEDKEANRQKAESIRTQLAADPTQLSKMLGNTEIDDDYYNVDPYYIVRDVYIQSMEDAAFALKHVGDVSNIVETDEGYYILVRMEDSEQILLSKSPALLQSYQWAKVEQIVDGFRTDLSIAYNDYGKSLDLLTIQ